MAGIYLHIPFCRQACNYCNFHFTVSLRRKNDFIPALLKEISLRKDYIGEEAVETVYFGGGTPSLLETEELKKVLDELRATYALAAGAEITLEANPDDMVDPRRLAGWRQAGINRLSIGVQSFFEEDLRWMNRAHSAGQAIRSIRMAHEEGLDNLSIDLIYGGPTLGDDHWEKNVEQALELGIPHLSCYALTVEEGTPLNKMIHQHRKQDVSSDDQARQFLSLMDWMSVAGYEHYEISNFALPGFRSRHNSSYWQGKTYLGLGPSAHSYNGDSRQWNIANNAQYIEALADGRLAAAEKELLTPLQQLNEYIMISLRTLEGLDLHELSDRFGIDKAQQLKKKAETNIQLKKVKIIEDRLKLTIEGKLFADGIAADLFFE